MLSDNDDSDGDVLIGRAEYEVVKHSVKWQGKHNLNMQGLSIFSNPYRPRLECNLVERFQSIRRYIGHAKGMLGMFAHHHDMLDRVTEKACHCVQKPCHVDVVMLIVQARREGGSDGEIAIRTHERLKSYENQIGDLINWLGYGTWSEQEILDIYWTSLHYSYHLNRIDRHISHEENRQDSE